MAVRQQLGLLPCQARCTCRADVRLSHLVELPFTDKNELRGSQDASYPFGDYVRCRDDQIVRLHRTSGTTGKAFDVAEKIASKASFSVARLKRMLNQDLGAQLWKAVELEQEATIDSFLNPDAVARVRSFATRDRG